MRADLLEDEFVAGIDDVSGEPGESEMEWKEFLEADCDDVGWGGGLGGGECWLEPVD